MLSTAANTGRSTKKRGRFMSEGVGAWSQVDPAGASDRSRQGSRAAAVLTAGFYRLGRRGGQGHGAILWLHQRAVPQIDDAVDGDFFPGFQPGAYNAQAVLHRASFNGPVNRFAVGSDHI